MRQSTSQADRAYSPLYFLASLGAGGLSVTFFMYLMFWVPHPGRPVPVFEDIAAAFFSGDLPMQIAIATAVAGIAVMATLNIRLLLWNLSALNRFKKTPAYTVLMSSNAQSALLAAPLAAAMTVNGLFIVGLVFVPGLWSIVEYLFPLAMIAFAAIAFWAFRLMGAFLGRILSDKGAFSLEAHNSFAQLMPAFALSMVAVGLAAPAAMSTVPTVVAVSLIASTLLATIAILYAAIAAITGVVSMLQNGVAKEAAPTLMVIVPLVTVLSIMALRQNHGLHTTFETHGAAAETMMFLAQMIAIQIAFLLLGTIVMRRQGYFADYISGAQTSPGSYALVCPGVAFSVLMHFFINKGLVAAQVIDKFGTAYWSLTAIALLSQALMVWLVFRLNHRHFSRSNQSVAVPAE